MVKTLVFSDTKNTNNNNLAFARISLYCILLYAIRLIDPCDINGESPCHPQAISPIAKGVCEVKNNGDFGCRSK